MNAKSRFNKHYIIIFGSPHRVRLFDSLDYPGISIADGKTIPFVNEIKNLRFILDSTLSWKPQINQVEKKVNCALFGLRFIKSCTTQALRIRLVQSSVTSHLDYCSVVYQDASLGLKARLQRLSNAAIRYIFGIGGMTRISPYRSRLGCLQTSSRTDYFALHTMYKVKFFAVFSLLKKSKI